MALLRGVVKSSECFLRNPFVLTNGWNLELSYSVRKTLNIPPPPKKPLTAYMIFCKDNRKELLKKEPTLTSTEQIKKLAAQWNGLTIAMKEPYEEKARKATVEYGDAHKRYYESLTEEQRQEIAAAKAEKKKVRLLTKQKKELRESGFPKAPLSSYPIFVQSESKGKNIKQAPIFMRETGEKWKSLSEAEKKKYEEESHKDKKRFTRELEMWKKKMISAGKEELVHRYEEMKSKGKPLTIKEVPESSETKKTVERTM